MKKIQLSNLCILAPFSQQPKFLSERRRGNKIAILLLVKRIAIAFVMNY